MPTEPIESVDTGYEVIIREGSTLLRRSLPPDKIGQSSWLIQRLGGYDSFTLSLYARTTELLNLTTGDRIEIWFGGKRQYRGWIRERVPTKGEPDSLTLTGYGRLFDMGKKYCDRLIINPAGADVRDYVYTVATKYVQVLFPDTVLEIPSSTAFTLTKLDTRKKTVQSVMQELVEATNSTYVWGFDVDPTTRADRFYFRSVGATRDGVPGGRVIAVPGPNVNAANGQNNAADVVNRLQLTGGTPTYPNLLNNASFEIPVGADENTGNLLANPSFEIGSTQSGGTSDWTMEDGASAKAQGGDTGEPDPYDGYWHIETDGDSEGFYQEHVGGIVAGHTYEAVWYARPQYDLTDGLNVPGLIVLYWRNGVGSYVYDSTVNFTCYQTQYSRFVARFVAPAGVTGFRIEALAGGGGGAGSLLWDKFSFYDIGGNAQQDWLLETGTSAGASVNWVDTTAPFHGAYNVAVTVSAAADTDAGDVRLYASKRVDITGGNAYNFSGWVDADAGGGLIAKTIPEVQFYKSDGTTTGDPFRGSLFNGADPGTWGTFILKATAPQNATSALVRIRMREEGTYRFDALTFQNILANIAGTVPGDPTGDIPYMESGALSVLLKAEDLVTTVENANVHNSFSDHGWREAQETIEDVTTIDQANAFGKQYFLSRAASQYMPPVTLVGPDYDLWTSDTLRLEGADGPALTGGQALPIARIRGGIDGSGVLSRSLENGREQPTLSALIRQTVKSGFTL